MTNLPYTIHNGNSIEVLKTLEENSIDSIVCDPPYELGFMNKKWDSTGIAYNVELWKECFRVLKPGGHILAFSGSRTYHRMAVAIEDAGFDIRDQIMWVYGCLSEDTDIVTPNGITSYKEVKIGDLVLCYDKDSKEYSYLPIEEIYEYDIKDTAYRITSDFTDQIVSRNHRCLVERNGREVFGFAEELKEKENIPILEDLQSLQKTISNIHKRTSNKKKILFKKMLQNFNWSKKFKEQTNRRAYREKISYLSSLWENILQKYQTFEKGIYTSLFPTMQWIFSWSGMEETFFQREAELDRKFQSSISKKNDRFNQSILERWRNISKKKGKLCISQICKMSQRIYTNGTKRWIYYGASPNNSQTFEQNFNKNGSCSSYKSQSIRQSNRKSNAFCDQPRPQTLRKWEGHSTTLATITPFEYEGKIWCVKVPTGSFVAVRNGKAFPTGNSGFPKSHDVSKAIDKMAGAEREVIESMFRGNNAGKKNGIMGQTVPRIDKITIPATEEAKQWEGWGTALKPAHEPICLARKPFDATVAENVLLHGTGAINIDGCRVELSENDDSRLGGKGEWKTDKAAKNVYSGGYSGDNISSSELGRFPANFIHDGSQEILSLFPDSKGMSGGGIRKKESDVMPSIQIKGESDNEHLCRNDEGSAARFFYCAKASKRDRDEGLDGFEERPTGSMNGTVQKSLLTGSGNIRETKRSNHHPTVKPTTLMQYLCRLITPPNGIILDPFMGSGSTGKAAMYEGFKFIGIDLDAEYCQIAKARIEFAIKDKNKPEKVNKIKGKKQHVAKEKDINTKSLW